MILMRWLSVMSGMSGLTHPNIHVVDFEEDKFKGVLSYDEVLHQFPHDTAKRELDLEQEEFKRETLTQFQKLFQQEQDTGNAKEQEKTKKEKQLEQKRLQAEKDYQRRQTEEKNMIEHEHMAHQATLQKKKEEEAKNLAEEEEAKRLANEAQAKKLAEEAEAKRLADEAESKKKVDEILKKNLNQTPGTPSTPNLGIVNIPPPEYTPISSIPGDSSLSSQALNFEGSVVAIGDYYFDNRTRSIEKRSMKRKRGEDTKSKSYAGRILEWKVGPDPEENMVQAASTLNTFAGLNASSVLEVTNALNIARN
jgi:hypothetical protein